MKWLKLYSESRTDGKLRCLTLAERGVWANLLCYANDQAERGTFDASDHYLLALECADGCEDVLESTLEKLLRIKHLTPVGADGRLTFRTWTVRQARKPSDEPEAAAQRKRTQRARVSESRAVTRLTPSVTSMSRVTVTKSHDVTRLESRVKREEDPSPPSERIVNVIPLSAAADADGGEGGDLNGLQTSSNGQHPLPSVASPLPTRHPSASPARQEMEPAAPAGTSKSVNPIWDALAEVLHYQPTTKPESSKWGKAIRDLREAGATAAEVRQRAARYVARYGDDKLTINAIVTHWSEFGPGVPTPKPRADVSAHRAGPTEPDRPLRTADSVALPADAWK